MPNGVSPRIVEDVLRSLRSDCRGASPDAIDRIVSHARAHVPFYRRLGGSGFEDLPVVTKPMLVADPDDFFDQRVQPDTLTSRMSSGTSGINFTSFFDDRRIAHHRAELVAAYRFLGADPFGSFLHCRDWPEVSALHRTAHTVRGKRLYAGERDPGTVRAIAGWLRRRRGTVIIGLPSYLEILFARFDDLGLTFPAGTVSAIVGTGEPATAVLKDASRRLFGVELSMRYSNTENGIFGLSEGSTTRYKLNTATFHVEILDPDADRPARPGAVGRIVITDLFNRAMPFLRYDTGDMGRFAVDSSGCRIPNVLEELAGRNRDFPIAGTADAPRRALYFNLLAPVEALPEVIQFQLRQHDIGRFTWVLHAARSRALETELRRILDDGLGDILSCDFVYLDGPPVDGVGKRQLFVNEIPDPEALLARG